MLYFLRHADAEDSRGSDDARRLTPKGEKQARAAGGALATLGEPIDACLASTRVRAAETARLCCRALGLESEPTDALRGGTFDALALTAGRGNVLLVGHEPDLSAAVAQLTGANVRLRKGGLAIVEGSALQALLRPGDLKPIAG